MVVVAAPSWLRWLGLMGLVDIAVNAGRDGCQAQGWTSWKLTAL